MKSFLKKYFPHIIIESLRQLYRKYEQKKYERLPRLSLNEMREFLVKELQVSEGDTLFIHANFSGMKLDGQPGELIQILLDLIGPRGNLLMPFYPLKSSYDFLMDKKPFDLRKHRTSTGALTIALAQTPGALKSLHPTKSVVVWGKDRDFLMGDHAQSLLPYSSSSPYARACYLPQSKIIGLGVDDFLSCVHVAVDRNEQYPVQPYHPDPLED